MWKKAKAINRLFSIHYVFHLLDIKNKSKPNNMAFCVARWIVIQSYGRKNDYAQKNQRKTPNFVLTNEEIRGITLAS